MKENVYHYIILFGFSIIGLLIAYCMKSLIMLSNEYIWNM